MVKYLVVLAVNIFVVYGAVLYFMDNRILTTEPLSLVRSLFFLMVALWVSYNIIAIYVLQKKKPETGLLYTVASKTKAYGIGFYEHVQPFKKEFITWSLVALGLIFLGFISMGLTGYLWLAIPAKLGLVREITGDAAWPAAILMGVTWPLLLPVAVLVKQQLIRSGHGIFAVSGFWGTVAGGIVILITLIYLLNGKR